MGHLSTVESRTNPCLQFTMAPLQFQPKPVQEQWQVCPYLQFFMIPSLTGQNVGTYQQGHRKAVVFLPLPGASKSWSQSGSAHMGILPSCLYLPLGKLSRKRPVNNLPKIYCRAAGGCKRQQMSAMHPEGTATCHVELPTKQHRPCMVPSEDLGPVHMGVHMRALISRVVCPQGCPPAQ